MIVHGETGYLAKAFDCKELAKGIAFCCVNKFLGANAEEKVKNEFSFKKTGRKYEDLLKRLLKEKRLEKAD